MIGKPGKQVSRYFLLVGPPEQDISQKDQAIGYQRDPLGQRYPNLQQVNGEQAEEDDRHQDGHILKPEPKDPGRLFQYLIGRHYSTTIRLLPPIMLKMSFL